MEIESALVAAVGMAALFAARQARREREHRYDIALLALTGAELGASALVIAA